MGTLPVTLAWEEFAHHARGVAEIILAGLWLNCLAYIPFGFLQAQGRPDLVAKLHLLELAPFVLILWLLLMLGGIQGAAIAWSLRVAVDALLLFYVAGLLKDLFHRIALPTSLVLISTAATLYLPHSSVGYIVLAVSLIISATFWAIVNLPAPLRNLTPFALNSASKPPPL